MRRNSPATTATRRAYRSRRSLVGWDAQKRPSRRISTIRLAIRHARSRRAIGECVAVAGRPRRLGTARATPTRIANAAIPARLRRNGPGNGFARRCARGECATALRGPRTTGRARTHAGAAATQTSTGRRMARTVHRHRSVRQLGGGPRRRLRRRLNARAIVPLLHPRLRLVICERGRRRSPHTPRPCVSAAATRASALGDCWAKGKRQRGVLAGRRGSGRRQAPRRLSQARQRRAADGAGRPSAPTCAPLATSASLAISAERPAISECRSATLAGAGLVSVPARERNQGSGLSGRGGGRPARAAGLAADCD